MSSQMMSNTGSVHELVSSYALNALDPSEKARFEEHLREGCVGCETELRAFNQVVDTSKVVCSFRALRNCRGGPWLQGLPTKFFTRIWNANTTRRW